MTTQTETAVARFLTVETEAVYCGDVASLVSKHAKADRNLVSGLQTTARLLGRPVSPEDWKLYLAKPVTKAVKAKVSADSVYVYVSHARTVTIAVCGRPSITDLPLGKHWADQRQGKRPEGINAYVKRVSALLKLATPNEQGHLILPEGYSLLGEAPKAEPEAPEAPKADAPTIETASDAQDAEGGLNVDPDKAKADARETAAIVLMGNVKAATALLQLLATEAGKTALAELMANPPEDGKETARRVIHAANAHNRGDRTLLATHTKRTKANETV